MKIGAYEAILQRAGLPGVQATVAGGAVFLEGHVETKEDLAKAELILKAMGEKAESLLTVAALKERSWQDMPAESDEPVPVGAPART